MFFAVVGKSEEYSRVVEFLPDEDLACDLCDDLSQKYPFGYFDVLTQDEFEQEKDEYEDFSGAWVNYQCIYRR